MTDMGQARIDVHNPVTGERIDSIAIRTAAEVKTAVARGRAAQPAWEALGARERARLIRRWQDALWDDRLNLMAVIRRETGKTHSGAYTEVAVIDVAAQYYSHHGPKLLQPQKRRALFPLIQKARLYYKPYGVIGFITPWNYPLALGLNDVIPALVAGNSVVIKPSEVTPFTSRHAVDLMHKVGIPADVVQIVTGDGSTGSALVDEVDYISFTGSTAVGRKVAVRAAERLIPYSLELGGKDPAIVLADANLDQAAAGVLRGSLENAGQVCASVERVYVVEDIYEAFMQRLGHYAARLRIGSGDGFEVHIGSLTNERELVRAETHVADAIAKGATLVFGGRRRPDLGPLFYEPAILTNVDHSMRLMQEETFGPLVAIMRVRDIDEAIHWANDSEYGLSATIFTRNLKRGEELAIRIHSGDVSINRPQIIFGTASLPMGGEKSSGVGRRNGPEGLLRFVKTQSVVVDSLLGSPPSLNYTDPFTLNAYMLIRRLRRWFPFI